MSLPRLRAEIVDGAAIARVLRASLRNDVTTVRLSAPPACAGQHLLEIPVPDEPPVVLLADPMGEPVEGGQRLHLRPVTREQMALLLELVERLDDRPSQTQPPAAEATELLRTHEHDERDETLLEAPWRLETAPTLSPDPVGAIESLVPPTVSGLPRPCATSRFPEHALLGRVVAGRYELEAVVGSGASAAVFRARDLAVDRSVAIKVLRAEHGGGSMFAKRFKAEALAASQLDHPNIARVLDFGIDGEGPPYLAMDLLNGPSLEAILAAQGRLSSRVAVNIALQAADALAFAHERGIIHQDVKPENIVLVRSDAPTVGADVVKVCDFGLAKIVDAAVPEDADLTLAGVLCGSPAYMSPEQASGGTVDFRTDVYSLGVATFQALTGALPHDGPNIPEILRSKILDPPLRVSSLVNDVSAELEAVVERALSTDREQRHPSARALAEELRSVLAGMR